MALFWFQARFFFSFSNDKYNLSRGQSKLCVVFQDNVTFRYFVYYSPRWDRFIYTGLVHRTGIIAPSSCYVSLQSFNTFHSFILPWLIVDKCIHTCSSREQMNLDWEVSVLWRPLCSEENRESKFSDRACMGETTHPVPPSSHICCLQVCFPLLMYIGCRSFPRYV